MDARDVIDFTTPQQAQRARRARPKVLLIVGAMVAGSAVALTTAIGLKHLARVESPPPLVLQDGGVSATVDERVMGAPAGVPVPIAGYRLEGALPVGPNDAAVWTINGSKATKEVVTALAGTLGLSGTPERADHGWVVTTQDLRLTVLDEPGLPWNVGSTLAIPDECLPPPVMDRATPDQAVSSCAVAGVATAMPAPVPATVPAPLPAPLPKPMPPNFGGSYEPPVPDEGETLKAARPLLDRLGLGDADVRVIPGTATVVANPVVGGFPTIGFGTLLAYEPTHDVGLRLASANGWLGSPEQGATYPLITATEAFEQLASGPIPEIWIDCPQDVKCLEPWLVTGARLGLMLNYAKSGSGFKPALVPAWLLTIADQPDPRGVIALTPEFIRDPRR